MVFEREWKIYLNSLQLLHEIITQLWYFSTMMLLLCQYSDTVRKEVGSSIFYLDSLKFVTCMDLRFDKTSYYSNFYPYHIFIRSYEFSSVLWWASKILCHPRSSRRLERLYYNVGVLSWMSKQGRTSQITSTTPTNSPVWRSIIHSGQQLGRMTLDCPIKMQDLAF